MESIMFHPFDGNDDTYACQAAAFAAAGRKASVSAEGAITYAMAKDDDGNESEIRIGRDGEVSVESQGRKTTCRSPRSISLVSGKDGRAMLLIAGDWPDGTKEASWTVSDGSGKETTISLQKGSFLSFPVQAFMLSEIFARMGADVRETGEDSFTVSTGDGDGIVFACGFVALGTSPMAPKLMAKGTSFTIRQDGNGTRLWLQSGKTRRTFACA